MYLVIAYVVTTLIFLAIDYVWLGYVAKDFYHDRLGHLMAEKVNFGVAAAFYLIYTIGIVIFAIKPALANDNLLLALGYGALLGLLAYGTYDVTNMATLKDWPVIVSVVDIVWGVSITAITAVAGAFLTSQFIDKI